MRLTLIIVRTGETLTHDKVVLSPVLSHFKKKDMKREPGFYWVKMSRYGGWIIAEYVVTKMFQGWFAPRVDQPFTDHQLAEIDENILTRK